MKQVGMKPMGMTRVGMTQVRCGILVRESVA